MKISPPINPLPTSSLHASTSHIRFRLNYFFGTIFRISTTILPIPDVSRGLFRIIRFGKQTSIGEEEELSGYRVLFRKSFPLIWVFEKINKSAHSFAILLP